MQRGQSDVPQQWLVADARLDETLVALAESLPRGSGILLLRHDLSSGRRERLAHRLRQVARRRGLVLVDEANGCAARVHNSREIMQARLQGAGLLFLSPMHETRSHPDWRPLPRMRAAALARLASGPVLALGGMNARRFARIRRLGFAGWAGIDAWMAR